MAIDIPRECKRSSDSMLLISIPQSKIEIGGEGGEAALEYLTKTIGRIEAVWKPVTATESFEIVRRRLFWIVPLLLGVALISFVAEADASLLSVAFSNARLSAVTLKAPLALIVESTM